ncbi:MAG: HDOD domain-containing protein [Pseudomonadota bacterium]
MLSPTRTIAPPTDTKATAATRARLIEEFTSDGDLMSLGLAIARVVELTSSEDEATQHLTYYVLADVALTQKILRLANSVFYRGVGSTPVTTISRAIFLLGFDTVRTTALALLLVDSLSNGKHAEAIRKELIESLCASLIGRELGKYSPMQGGEEASIAALFSNMGRMLMASREHALYQRIATLATGMPNQAQAAIQVIGCTYEFLTETVLREWNFPPSLVQALESLPSGAVRPPRNRQEWMRQVVAFSTDGAGLVLRSGDSVSHSQCQTLLARYGTALHLDLARLTDVFAVVGRDIAQVLTTLELTLDGAAAPSAADASTLPSILKQSVIDTQSVQRGASFDSGKPRNASELLLAGVLGATQMVGAGNSKPIDLIMLVLETLYSSMGFRFATICVRDKRSNMYRAIASMGELHVSRQPRFTFPTASSNNIFHLALENNADLMISNADSPKIRDLRPAWHQNLMPNVGSMMILPLVQANNPLGLFYADRNVAAPEGVTSDEAALIKTLVGQMMAVIGLC